MAEIYQKATAVRSNFSMIMDQAIYERPQFISRTRDKAVLLSEKTLCSLLNGVVLRYRMQKDTDGFIITNDQIQDIIGAGTSEDTALQNFCTQLWDYANDYYEEFGLYSRSPNRKDHLPYVMRILAIGNAEGIKEMLKCQAGEI